MIALSAGDEASLVSLAPTERARAKARLAELLALVSTQPGSEARVAASALRLRLGHRAERVLFTAANADLPTLRADPRWLALADPQDTGIASACIDGYLPGSDVATLVRDFLLTPAHQDSNVVIHVPPLTQRVYPESALRLAADLAEQRTPREELRAAELLHEVAQGVNQ